MTQNPRPHDGSLESTDMDEEFASGQPRAYPSGQDSTRLEYSAHDTDMDSDSKSEAAKDEAGNVARHAKEAAQNVTETAKDEAASVVAEAKTSARDLFDQAKADLSEQAGTQQQKVAEGLRSVSTELHSMVSASDQSGVATDLVRQAAERSSSVASWLDERDPGSLLAEVKSFARQKPGTFLLLAAGAGILAGRISRNLSADAPTPDRSPRTDTGTANPTTPVSDTLVTPPPVQVDPPSVDTPVLGTTDKHASNPAGTNAGAPFGAQDSLGSDPVVVTGPLKSADPLGLDPFNGGPR